NRLRHAQPERLRFALAEIFPLTLSPSKGERVFINSLTLGGEGKGMYSLCNPFRAGSPPGFAKCRPGAYRQAATSGRGKLPDGKSEVDRRARVKGNPRMIRGPRRYPDQEGRGRMMFAYLIGTVGAWIIIAVAAVVAVKAGWVERARTALHHVD